MSKFSLFYFTDRPIPTHDTKIKYVFMKSFSQKFDLALVTDSPICNLEVVGSNIKVFNVNLRLKGFNRVDFLKYFFRSLKFYRIASVESIIIIRNNIHYAFFLTIFGCKHVFLEINFPYYIFNSSRIKMYMYRYFFSKGFGTIFLTDSMRKEYLGSTNSVDCKSIISGMGVENSQFAIYEEIKLELRLVDFVYIGTLSFDRGFDVIFEAFNILELRGHKVNVLFIGGNSDSEIENFLELIAKYHFVNIKISFKNWIPQNELIKELSVCRFGLSFIKPELGYRISSPTKFVEYIANLIPPLSNFEICEQSKYSDLFPTCGFSAEQISEVLIYAYQIDSNEYMNLIHNCLKIRDIFNYENISHDLHADILCLMN